MKNSLPSVIVLICLAMLLPQGALSQTDSEDESSAGGLELVIVTAQFRDENVQEAPISVSAFNGESLDARSASDINDAANFAPNVTLTRGPGGFGQMSSIFMRGIGQADPHFAVEPGVGVYIDDVYYGVLTGAIFELLDTDRIEVLRGPQGTLAGKNSVGGAIKLFSQQPDSEPNAYVEVAFGSYDRITARAATNITIVEQKLHARVSAMSRRRDGYVDRLDYTCVTDTTSGGATQRLRENCLLGTQGAESVMGARGVLLWTPNNRISNSFSFDVTQDESENPPAKQVFQFPTWAGANSYLTGPESYTNFENYQSTPTGTIALPFNMPDRTPLDALGLSNTLDIEFGNGLIFKSITAYRESTVALSTQAEMSPASLADQAWRLDHEQFTQEFRLSGGQPSRIEWTVGLFTYDADGVSEGRVNLPGGFAFGGGGLDLDILFRDPVETESDSIFAHAVFHPSDRISVTTGVRYTDDLKRFTFNRWDFTGAPHPVLGQLVDFTSTYEGDQTDYRVAIDYLLSGSTMFYAQVSTGYKGGGVNPRPFFTSQALAYEPEVLDSLELGVKTQLADDRVRFNAAFFRSDFDDLQLTLTSCDVFSPFPGAPCLMSANVGDAEIKGLELEVLYQPTDHLTIDGSLGLLDFEYTRVDPRTLVTLEMDQLYSPDEERAVGIDYRFDLPNGGSLSTRLDYAYRSEVESLAINSPLSQLDDLSLLNLRLAWVGASDEWSAALTITNITDEFYYESQLGNGLVPDFSITRRPGWPREAFLSLKRSF